ncbi:hypothetical protein Lgra_1507 [Legionella gratiana]|uniref:Uncharacterized protein n=1 Tax=Legionella gratiana TaxID=45066 RepID=A0A378JHK0_9GAMM|nr:hypothetical protein [Legionella gratiana]KTD12049.1 hypothetical protein Lgra_1507 [Legionella gratiana]STX46347.1 Uncharacterised protein [Legionella gratiana]
MKAKQERSVSGVAKKITILDFDQTVSIQHTFGEHCLDNHQNLSMTDIYQLGKNHAIQNVKMGIEAVLKHNDSDELTAIATYHNNPTYIAGYVSRILGKELIFQKTLYSTQPTTAINVYKVAGIERPFLISYLPDLGLAFQTKVNQLAGKNNQINFLTQVLNNEGQIDINNFIINFYDDTQKNYTNAKGLPKVNSFWVQGNTSKFSLQEQHLCTEQTFVNVENNQTLQIPAVVNLPIQPVAMVNPNTPTRNPAVYTVQPVVPLNNNPYGYVTGRDAHPHYYVSLPPNNNPNPVVSSPAVANPVTMVNPNPMNMPTRNPAAYAPQPLVPLNNNPYGYVTGRDARPEQYVSVAPNNNPKPAVISPVITMNVTATPGVDLSGVRVNERRLTSDNVSCTEISCSQDQANFIMMELKKKGISVLQQPYMYNNFFRIKIASDLKSTVFINNLIQNYSLTLSTNRAVNGGDFFNATNRNNTSLEGIVNPLNLYKN